MATLAAVNGLGIEVQVCLHSGEYELQGDDLSGLAVHIAARVGARPAQGSPRIRTVKDLCHRLGDCSFATVVNISSKGLPGTWRLFAVSDRAGAIEASWSAQAHRVRGAVLHP